MNNDFISRAELLANTENYVLSAWGPAIAVSDIEDVDRVDAEPVRHGRWVFSGYGKLKASWDCSECAAMVSNKTRYCSSCGAKMGL